MNLKSTRPGMERIALMIIAALAAAAVVWQAWVWHDDDRDDDRRTEAVETAEAQVLDLTTMDKSTVKDQLKKMGARLSGDFKAQFNGFAENFVNTVTEDRITAEGSIDGSAVSEYDGASAAVIVAATADVGRGRQQAVERHWRFRVELERDDDKWLISGMEFVQ